MRKAARFLCYLLGRHWVFIPEGAKTHQFNPSAGECRKGGIHNFFWKFEGNYRCMCGKVGGNFGPGNEHSWS